MYEVEVIRTGFLSGTLSQAKLAKVLNDRAAAGWRLSRVVDDEQRVLILFKREAHFLIFERG